MKAILRSKLTKEITTLESQLNSINTDTPFKRESGLKGFKISSETTVELNFSNGTDKVKIMAYLIIPKYQKWALNPRKGQEKEAEKELNQMEWSYMVIDKETYRGLKGAVEYHTFVEVLNSELKAELTKEDLPETVWSAELHNVQDLPFFKEAGFCFHQYPVENKYKSWSNTVVSLLLTKGGGELGQFTHICAVKASNGWESFIPTDSHLKGMALLAEPTETAHDYKAIDKRIHRGTQIQSNHFTKPVEKVCKVAEAGEKAFKAFNG